MSTNDRIRGRRLQAIRAAHFRAHPLCVLCQAKVPPVVRAATELDHTTPICKGGADNDENRQGLCTECHDLKTAADLGYRMTGADTRGLPTNPLHPWNR